jgi:hypothetical protein
MKSSQEWNMRETFLGLDLDENLRKVKQFVGTNALKTMYNSMILPHLSYGIAAWGGTSDKAIKRLKVHQKRPYES